MKKLFKALAVCAVAGTLCAGTAAIAGCSNEVTGEAYGVTHGNGCGYASVTLKDGKVTKVTLDEVFLPGNGGCKGENGNYAEITYGDVTITYDANDSVYKVGTQTIIEYLATEANAKAYYQAAMNGEFKGAAEVGGTKETIDKNSMNKELYGYWPRNDKNGDSYSRWVMNRDATVNYVLEYGVDNLLKLTLVETATPDAKEDKDVKYWMDGEINTGATWSDLNSNPANYLSYAKLITNAYNVVVK